MKYILLLILTFPIFAQAVDNSKSASTDNANNPTKTIEPEKESSQPNTESKDNTNLTQSEIRKKRKLEIGIGYGDGDQNLSPTRYFNSLSLEYNLTSRFSVGYSQLHKEHFTTSLYLNPKGIFSVLEKTNSLEVGLINFRYYFFEKFPLYITGGIGRDYVSRIKTVEYQYAYKNQDGTSAYSPVIRETSALPSNYKFLGFGFQWIFQNGFFVNIEVFRIVSSYTNKGNFLILDKNYNIDGILFEMFLKSSFADGLNTDLSNIRLGYSLQF